MSQNMSLIKDSEVPETLKACHNQTNERSRISALLEMYKNHPDLTLVRPAIKFC
jgi:hypothetical protein